MDPLHALAMASSPEDKDTDQHEVKKTARKPSLQDLLSSEQKVLLKQLVVGEIANAFHKRIKDKTNQESLKLDSVENKEDDWEDHETSGTESNLYMGPYGTIRSPFKKRSSLKTFPSVLRRKARLVVCLNCFGSFLFSS